MKKMMAQREDHRLAELAWQVLHIRQLPADRVKVTEEEDKAARALRPVW